LASLGLSLSGCEVEETNKALALKMVELYPRLCCKIPQVCSDTVGSLLTASDKGGVVLIAGTGSNSLLVNPDGSIARCGGWGHMLGDEGAAWWIAQKAIKTWFDDEDNMVKAPHSTKKVAEAVKEYFGVEDRFGVLTFCYDKFAKPHFAGNF
jgi:N-acetylglucosamine kinase